MARKKHEDGPPLAAATPLQPAAGSTGLAQREIGANETASERAYQTALRPQNFDDYIGQRDLIDNLKVSVRAAKQKGWTLDHFLFAASWLRQNHACPRDCQRTRRELTCHFGASD